MLSLTTYSTYACFAGFSFGLNARTKANSLLQIQNAKTMATASWETYALTGRFKTSRRKKRLVKKEADRNLILQFKELQKLRIQQRNLGFKPLIPPVQKGWKRFFVLRKDVLASKDKDFFLQLLEKINTVTYSHRKDFKHKRRRRGKKVDVDRVQKLREFYAYEFRKLILTEKEKVYFKTDWRVTDRGHLIPVQVFTEPWRFALKVEPNMITEVRIIDPQLKSQEQEIDARLSRNHLYPRLYKLTGENYSRRCRWKSYDKERYRQVVKTDPLDELNY